MEINYTLKEIDSVAKQIISKVTSKTLLFYGDMGAGKTTLIKAIVAALGSQDEVSSPTFSLVNEYAADEGLIYHFDLYRIEDLEEAYNFGIEDYLDSSHWKLIEWPEKIETLLSHDCHKIMIDFDNANQRVLKIS
ncbi:tRNA (adenosine(37)-N6)-threonylcarbamoyltransferase complex ATPase subunit type 1 TsaE [Oceanihabitans sp. IOP_32]|uniref:tRNA (adenosine(37)-N6)-threonylcarbamoyltransferase complex ATPase subunit type 1 TsaE n=1 Tax=Oceanihabitans sp. IOP_32 TaxID=2529032 RepID=UPI00129308E8|nr:tRNA (adenosine(37)-N6)-threonylcarbamoyltransferase complex ATPase subunit type 1 TsaE [Oceanihabitans sp. IOP_32]QFZ55808.1 tRNA (adenosine(37)-N6)-threonylcarbamoyltransferase complex ATPase subunit type 1 TsaE [Oceanihabitans sp. IOP_32]